ncbi:hypothetical protein SUDANB25_01661 [Streptomyces sp. SudanB25_2051]
MEGLREERVGAERGGDAGVDTGGGSAGGAREVVFDVVAAAEEERHEDGVSSRGQAVEGVGEERLVQLDVAEADGQAGAQGADLVEQGPHGGQGAGVAAAVGDGDQGRCAHGRPARSVGGGVGIVCRSWRVEIAAVLHGGDGCFGVGSRGPGGGGDPAGRPGDHSPIPLSGI